MLIEQGYNDPQTAMEVAGTILSIQRSDLSYDQKEEWLRGLGFAQPQQVLQAAGETLSHNFDVKTDDFGAKAAAESKRLSEQKAAEERANAINRIAQTKIGLYSFDEVSLSESQVRELDAMAQILNSYTDFRIAIVGHTCNIGNKSVNLRKWSLRAQLCRDYLVSKGVVAERITVESMGEEKPVADNKTKQNREQNRRIELSIL